MTKSYDSCRLIYFWPCCAACRVLVPQLGIEPAALAVKAWSPNHWTARKLLIVTRLDV